MKNHLIENGLCIIFNGPPGCGKDTLANKMVELGAFRKQQFKDVLYEHTARHFQVDLDKYTHAASTRELKDSKSFAGLGGRTPRQALIHVSEDIYKPRFGADYFGRATADNIRKLKGRVRGPVNVVFPDGGFDLEIPPVESEFGALLYIRLHRNGFTFEGDSRNYVYLPDTETRSSVDLTLFEGEIDSAVATVLAIIEDQFGIY